MHRSSRSAGCATASASRSIHEDLDLDVRRGEILGVVGGSGTGKSVLMRSIIGLQTPDAGEIEVFGENDDRPRRGRGERTSAALGHAVPGRRAVLDADRRRECRGADPRILSRTSTPPLLDEIASYKIAMTRPAGRCRPEISRRSCRAAWASAPASPARSRSIPSCCSSTSRPPGSTRSARRRSTS